MNINKELKEYIENNIFSEYEKNDKGHNLEHIKYVINRSIKFADTIPDIDYNIVYTVAAYHDIGHHIDPKKHELISAEIMYANDKLKEFFNDEERIIIKEAIEDHRASSKHEPRSIYGKIVSTADRNNTVESSDNYESNVQPIPIQQYPQPIIGYPPPQMGAIPVTPIQTPMVQPYNAQYAQPVIVQPRVNNPPPKAIIIKKRKHLYAFAFNGKGTFPLRIRFRFR